MSKEDLQRYNEMYPDAKVIVVQQQQQQQSHFLRNVCCCIGLIIFLILFWPAVALLIGALALGGLCLLAS